MKRFYGISNSMYVYIIYILLQYSSWLAGAFPERVLWPIGDLPNRHE